MLWQRAPPPLHTRSPCMYLRTEFPPTYFTAYLRFCPTHVASYVRPGLTSHTRILHYTNLRGCVDRPRQVDRHDHRTETHFTNRARLSLRGKLARAGCLNPCNDGQIYVILYTATHMSIASGLMCIPPGYFVIDSLFKVLQCGSCGSPQAILSQNVREECFPDRSNPLS